MIPSRTKFTLQFVLACLAGLAAAWLWASSIPAMYGGL